MSVSVAVDEARTTENVAHLASLLEGPVSTPRKDSKRVLEVVGATCSIVVDSKESKATEETTREFEAHWEDMTAFASRESEEKTEYPSE